MISEHKPVLSNLVTKSLQIKQDGIYVDCTYGRGGHTKKILDNLGNDGRIIAIDRDQDAEEHAIENFSYDKRFIFERTNFSNVEEIVNKYFKTKKIDGIVIDLGVSSPQIDNAERGFSFNHDGPLDMRMDKSLKTTAEYWINNSSVSEIEKVLKDYGEEKYAKKIAKAIEERKAEDKITSTLQLSSIIKSIYPRNYKYKINPATKTFQAIRIYINDELSELNSVLNCSINILKIGARLVVISFHSLEDRIVKNFIKKHSSNKNLLSRLPIRDIEGSIELKEIKAPIRANSYEIDTNIRARSARFRVAEKV
ncbi:MAG: 16S rRNA (cytosine(1402)-N(4))-methyltransferase RsmH [Pseudomonadota bacterium]|nr:16S rRNA (cytosine(1402)-N(4))-methyltransferase RsmH [Pseudomonadota bacterium]